jgi:hypothetical protein
LVRSMNSAEGFQIQSVGITDQDSAGVGSGVREGQFWAAADL